MHRHCSYARPRRCTWLQGLAHSFSVLVFLTLSAPLAHAQTIGTIGLTPGWATFGQAVPQGAAPSGLQVGALLTQTDVKTRWPDGSIRFAVVTVNALAAGNYAITPAPIASGAFTPAVPAASVALSIGAVTYTAALPATASPDLWLSGALAYEGRTVMAPVSSADGSAHPFLRVIFDTRVYSDGSGRVDVTVENVLDKTGATTVTYNATITVKGQAVFTKSSVQHYYLTRWRKTFPFGSTPAAAVTPDIAPFNTSGALPPYSSVVANIVNAPTGATYDILQNGALNTNMPEHGGRPELAPYPNWTARYLVYRNPTQRSFVLANGDLAGSWPVHVREAENSAKSGVGAERIVSINQRPTLWLDDRAQTAGYDFVHGTPLPIREYGSTVPGPGQSPLIPDTAHQPSLAYVPYLLTGDRYYAEEMAFWANYSMIRTYPGDGVRSSTGILEYGEVRGYGWGLRNIVDAAALYPDVSGVRAYLIAKVNSNLQWLDNYANAQNPATNPFQILWLFKRPDGNQYISMWENSYLMHAIDRAHQQGFAGGLAHRDAIARFQLKLFTSDPDYPRAQAAPYIVAVGVPGASATLSAFTFYTSMAQIWSATQGQERPFAGYYGPEARMSLLVGIQNGWPGAQAAYDYLWPFLGTATTYCPDGGPNIPDLACRAGWALALPSTTTPPPPTSPAHLTSPAAGSTLAGSSQMFTWDAGLGAASYRLDIGSTQGATNILAGTATTATSLNATGLPTDGSTIWVRLSSSINGSWQFVDYSFVTATISSGGGGSGPLTVKSTVFADGTGAVTAGPISAAAGDLVMAFATAAGPAAGGQTLTITGGGLTWTRVARANAMPGLADIWRATATAALSNLSVTSTPSVSTYTQSLTVVTFSGAGGSGASATASTTGAPTVSLTATKAGSLVFGVGNDWDGATARTLGASQVMAHQWLSTPTGDTYWVQNTTTPTASAGVVVQINDTAPTTDRFNLAAVEVVAAAAGVTTPTITWPAPSAIVYGTKLGASQLNATASVPGTFAYSPAAGTVLGAGTQTLSVTFTPTDAVAYTTATKSVSITVTKATPLITWAAPANIVYGTALSATQLNATTTMPGGFVYTPASGTILGAGASQTLSVTFTPTDTANYTSATKTVAITVTKKTPTIAWPAPASIVYGTALSGTQLNATTTTTAGSFVYTPASGTILGAAASQTLSVTFTPTDTADYNSATKTVAIAVAKATPAITWASPASITAGTALGAAQLNATASVAGSFVYSPAAGTILAAGANQTLSTTFTPTDATDYNSATKSVTITVTAGPSVTLGATTANAGGIVTATAANGPGAPGDFVALYDSGGTNAGWWYLNGTRTMPATGLSGGTVSFTLPAAAGTYQARFYSASYSLLATSGSVVVTMPSVVLSASTGTAGGIVTATIANAPGTAGDWAGLYDAAGNAVTWQFLNGSQTMPPAGVTSAVLTFMLPSAAGTYHVRLFNGSYTRVATSGTITTTAPTVTLSSSSANAGGRITATIANGPGMPGDWAGLYDAGGAAVQWQYLNGTQVKPATGVTSAVLTFNLPAAAGTYQVRLFNASYVLVAASGAVTTTAGSVTLSAATGNAGGVVTATIANAPGTPGDWVGLYDAAGNAVSWQYLNGTQTMPAAGVTGATVTFALPPTAGTFYVRLCNDSYVQVATSGTITTTVATLTPSATVVGVGGVVTVSIANAPGTPGDWAGLFDATGSALQWQFLDGTQTMPVAGVTSATLTFTMPMTPGTYQVRLFNGSYLPIAVSAPLSVN